MLLKFIIKKLDRARGLRYHCGDFGRLIKTEVDNKSLEAFNMRKTLTAALTAALVVGTSATTLAAANPFSDVPAGHWAYRAVANLAADGVIEGYGDGTYRGDRLITRYEMAQMIAKAIARSDEVFDKGFGDNSARKKHYHSTKADLDRLAAEFRDELDALGVRVAELEKYADKVIWTGKIEYTYTSERTDPENTGHKHKENSNGYVFRLEPKAEVNDHWTVNARIDAEGDMKHDTTTDFTLARAWAEGDYDKFNVKIGKFEFCPEPEFGLMWDTEISGASLSFGSKWQFNATGGRVSADGIAAGVDGENFSEEDPATVVGLGIQYDQGETGFYGGGAWYLIKDDDLIAQKRNERGDKKANIWTANLGYKFSDMLTLKGAYAKNTKADIENYSWHAELDYGNYDDASEKGQWAVYGGYRRYGTNVSFAPTDDDTMRGTRGWVVGASWTPFKNIGVQAKYFNGKHITGRGDAEKLFGRVEFFF